jgi:hypothetical protein
MNRAQVSSKFQDSSFKFRNLRVESRMEASGIAPATSSLKLET